MPTVGHARTPDGRTLHLEVTGEAGGPTVVFESGLGSSRTGWALVTEALAGPGRRLVAYDRSGFGRSPAHHGARNLSQLADDLGVVLDHLGEGPFVLVGHSWGGPIVRTVAGRRPDGIAGLVLVDATDELADLYFAPAQQRQFRLMTKLVPFGARIGLTRLFVKRMSAPLPEDAARTMVAEDSSLEAARAMQAELASINEDLASLRDAPPALPDIPVTVITGTRPTRFGSAARRALLDAHRRRVKMLPRGRHVEASRSAHHVHLSEPDVVVGEVERLLADLA